MSTERLEVRQERAAAIVERLDAAMPGARIELDHNTPLELLVAVVLSAQCTDKRVNQTTPALFERFRSAQDYAAAQPAELERFIRSCGLYHSKARNLVALGRSLVETHAGEVPIRRSQLEELPGVGKKTAGVVSLHLGGDLAFPVDTHVKRLAFRMGLSSKEYPEHIELELKTLLPKDSWAKAHQLLVWHGRRTCTARAPACERCVVDALCPKRGVRARLRRSGARP